MPGFTVHGSDGRRIWRHVGREYAQSRAAELASAGETCVVTPDDQGPGGPDAQVFEASSVAVPDELQADGILQDESDISDLTVDEAEEQLIATATLDELDQLEDQELSGKGRKGVLDAIEKRRNELEAAA